MLTFRYSCGNVCAPMDSRKVLRCYYDSAVTEAYKNLWEVSVGSSNAEDYLEIWKKSPGHNAAILDPRFQFIGCHEGSQRWVNCELLELFNPI